MQLLEGNSEHTGAGEDQSSDLCLRPTLRQPEAAAGTHGASDPVADIALGLDGGEKGADRRLSPASS